MFKKFCKCFMWKRKEREFHELIEKQNQEEKRRVWKKIQQRMDKNKD